MAAVDFIMPVKNGAPYIALSIESVIRQTFRDWRLVIVDHSSTDESFAVASAFAARDGRIRVHSAEASCSHSDVRNLALSLCDARCIMIQDADDVSLPHRAAVTLDFFRSHPLCIAVSSNLIVIDSVGTPIGRWLFPSTPSAITAGMFFYYTMPHPASAINLAALKRTALEYDKDLLGVLPSSPAVSMGTLAEDYYLFAQLSLLGAMYNLPTPLLQYRLHAGGVSRSRQSEQTRAALVVSRFLARGFSRLHNLPAFDPAPFCSHAERIYDCGKINLDDEFQEMTHILRQGLPASDALDRELAFRRVLATRRAAPMGARYLFFSGRHGHRASERRVVRNWIFRGMSSSNVEKISLEASLDPALASDQPQATR
jgi:glycosyltransferase involved in cell wall biosynthesis